jgi:hypothetical protein
MLKNPSIINGKGLVVDRWNTILLEAAPEVVDTARAQRELEDTLKRALTDGDEDAVLDTLIALKEVVPERRLMLLEAHAGLL